MNDKKKPAPRMTGKQARKLLDAVGKSSRGFAKELGVDERTMRKFLNGHLPINRRTAIAIRCLCEHQQLLQPEPE